MARYDNPLIVSLPQFSPKDSRGSVTYDEATESVTVGSAAKSRDIFRAVRGAMQGHDYVLLEFPNGSPKSDYTIGHTSMAENAIRSAAGWTPVVERMDDTAYVTSKLPSSVGKRNVPVSDERALTRKGSASEHDWERHQADVIGKFHTINGLSDKHKAMLEAPDRGLEDEDVKDFFDWNSNQPVSPNVMGDDMVGIPGIARRELTDDMEFFDRDGSKLADEVVALTTTGLSGIAIPMRNVWGDSTRFQTMTDPSPISVDLKLKATDGSTITKGDYMDKKSRVYNFRLKDGNQRSKLQLESASLDGLTFKDVKGTFDCKLKQELTDVLKDRGYNIPDTVGSIKPQLSAKYIWLSKGSMIGTSKDVQDEVAPTKDGFVDVRAPKNGSDQYVAIVCEGALKGVIAGKYLTRPDADGKTMADAIAGRSAGIVLVQVPGVAESFVKTAEPIYTKLTTPDGREGHVAGTLIAMDADGATNRAVANGVRTAERALEQFGNGHVKVLCWNPEYKGLDDALLGVSRNELKVSDLGIKFGSAAELFPMDKARWPEASHIDGTKITHQEIMDKVKEHQDKATQKAAEAPAAKHVPTVEAPAPAPEPMPEPVGVPIPSAPGADDPEPDGPEDAERPDNGMDIDIL